MNTAKAWSTGKILCILGTLLYGVLPVFIDTLDPHHLMNPAWPPHARLHLLWQICTGFLISMVATVLFVKATPKTVERVYIGGAIGASLVTAFMVSASLKNLVGSAFDADNRVLLGFIPPALLHFLTAGVLIAIGVWLCRNASMQISDNASTHKE